jgi:hypothetical protein
MLSFLEAEMADFKDNPHEFWRKETVKDCGSLELGSSATGLREEVEKTFFKGKMDFSMNFSI